MPYSLQRHAWETQILNLRIGNWESMGRWEGREAWMTCRSNPAALSSWLSHERGRSHWYQVFPLVAGRNRELQGEVQQGSGANSDWASRHWQSTGFCNATLHCQAQWGVSYKEIEPKSPATTWTHKTPVTLAVRSRSMLFVNQELLQ